jgi:hypothetical protein
MHLNEDRESGMSHDASPVRKTGVPRSLPKTSARTKMSVFTRKLEAKQRGQANSRFSGSSPFGRSTGGQGLFGRYLAQRKTDALSRKSNRTERFPSEQYQVPAQPVELMTIEEASNRKGVSIFYR